MPPIYTVVLHNFSVIFKLVSVCVGVFGRLLLPDHRRTWDWEVPVPLTTLLSINRLLLSALSSLLGRLLHRLLQAMEHQLERKMN